MQGIASRPKCLGSLVPDLDYWTVQLGVECSGTTNLSIRALEKRRASSIVQNEFFGCLNTSSSHRLLSDKEYRPRDSCSGRHKVERRRRNCPEIGEK